MLYLFLRIIWRIIVFIIGTAIAYGMYRLYPYARDILPMYAVFLLIYCLVAYLVVPSLTRLLHIVIKPDHVPLYATTRDGIPSDPVNLAIVAKDKKMLQKTMQRAGWYQADEHSLRNDFREAISIAFNRPYPTAPMSMLYLFNRPHDIAFQIPTGKNMSARTRHHVRFWQLREAIDHHNDHNHFAYYTNRLKNFFHPVHSTVWIGAAIEDTHPVGIRRRGTLTHRINKDADAERDYIIETLEKSKAVKTISTTRRGETTKFRGQQFRNSFTVNGSIKVIELKNHHFRK